MADSAANEISGLVLNTPGKYVDAQRPFTIVLLVPTQKVGRSPRRGLLLFESLAHTLFHLFLEPIGTHIRHQIFQTSVLAVAASTVVSLDSHNGLCEPHGILLRNPSQIVGLSRESLGGIVGPSSTTTGVKEIAIHFTVRSCGGSQRHVVGKQINGVVACNGHSNFELSGQVCVQINGVGLFLGRLGLIVQPDLVVSVGT
mmetsp:Transcript_43761/g.73840  ORF Transcript_43761/g.73840 Transcript_43761/m.73840 type:complete len:200 (+) Transcript_43761:2033-2632(+)